jgi:hypothetical protein
MILPMSIEMARIVRDNPLDYKAQECMDAIETLLIFENYGVTDNLWNEEREPQ